MGACLWLGEEAAVSHLTAATLLRLDGCSTKELHMSVPSDVRRRARDGVHLHRTQLERVDRVVVDAISCTSATRTLIDCASLLGEEALEVAFEAARRMGLTSPRALALRADALVGRGKAGSRAIRTLLSHQRPGDAPLQYRLEVKAARLLRESSLPRPTRQYPVGPYRIDFGVEPWRVGAECEGFDFHGTRLVWKRDKRRTAWIEARGWRLVVLTWDDVTRRPEETLARLALALGA